MARGPLDPADPEDYTRHAMDLAREQHAWVVHSNWARHVQFPELPHTGKSMVVAPSGQVVLEAPEREPGLLLAWKDSCEKAWRPGVRS